MALPAVYALQGAFPPNFHGIARLLLCSLGRLLVLGCLQRVYLAKDSQTRPDNNPDKVEPIAPHDLILISFNKKIGLRKIQEDEAMTQGKLSFIKDVIIQVGYLAVIYSLLK